MNVLLFGAKKMVGDAVLHEYLADPRVDSVLAITRSPLASAHPKVRELLRSDFLRTTTSTLSAAPAENRT